MTSRIRRPFLFTALAASGLALVACQTDKHGMVEPKPGEVAVWSKCYDQIRKVRSTGGPRAGLATNRTITTHRCEECRTEMSIYTENGVLMVKCATCAPEGVRCDRCLPRNEG